MENISSEQELLELRRDGKITEDEYKQLLDAMRKSVPNHSQKPINIARKYTPWFGLAIIIIIAAAIYLIRSDYNAGIVPQQKGHFETNTIIPKVRVGNYALGMSKDDVLKSLGKPKRIFYGGETQFLIFDDVSFGIVDASVKGIGVHSSLYKFANGLGVGDSEQKIKQAFGDGFHLKETEWKDFLTYEDQGLQFEIHKKDRTVIELSVFKSELMLNKKAHLPLTSTIDEDGRIVDKIDYPFINDSQIIGTWKSVDFVDEMEQFKVGEKQWKGRGGELFLKELIFLPNGRTFKPWWTWTKGLVFHSGDKTASKYTLKDMEGSTYMFFEWKSGDYTIRHRKPSYYVLKKVSSETVGLAEAWASQPSDAEFARQLPAKIEELDIDTATLEQVKEIFGKPAQYIWGRETFTEDNLPRQYILVYPSKFHIYMCENQIVELRHESGSNYVFRDKLRSGSMLDEVFEVIGHPKKTVEGEKNLFEDGVLYKDIDGRKGHCYYARSDQNVRFFFLNYKVSGIYITRSNYNGG